MGSAWWQCAACLRAQEEDICELQLNHCNLCDVPPDVFIYERTLEKLYLDANSIKDLPRPLFQCHELRVLSLSDNEITTLPPAIASLINLENLDLSKNSLKELPDSIKECKNLKSIDISVNLFERFPDAITHIIGLQELYINDAYIEYLPANFGRLSSLRTLELRENNMMTLPKSMSRLIKLQRLDIGNNDFTELPEVVGDLTSLTELWIDGNEIRRIPENIEQLHQLNHFDCTMNAVNLMPAEIRGWRDISIMNLSSNEIYELPDSICYLQTIVTLKIDDNRLNSLPDDIGQMSNLEELIVTKNFLEFLPPSLGLLRKLHCLNADNNYLRSLPPEIGSCTALSLLSLRSNNLTRVPPELGHLSSLRVLNLVNNCIDFLPVSMLNLTNLKALWLSDNQSQPLVPLQPEFNSEEGMMVLSCFMLPQKPQMEHTTGPSSGAMVGSGRKICFAAEIDFEVPRQLHRAPTPYPKELRNLAKHARNIQNQSVHDQRVQSEQKIMIKEAVVAKATVSMGVASKSRINSFQTYSQCTSSPIEYNSSKCQNNDLHESEMEHNVSSVNPENSVVEASTTVLATEKSLDIREAKCVRNPSTEYLVKSPPINNYVNSTWKSDEYSKTNTAKIIDPEKFVEPGNNKLRNVDDDLNMHTFRLREVPPVPPPYHIAAAFSKKAAFFQQLNQGSSSEIHTQNHHKSVSNESSFDDHAHQIPSESNIESATYIRDEVSLNESEENGKTISIDVLDNGKISGTIDSDPDRPIKPSKIPILRVKNTENSYLNYETLDSCANVTSEDLDKNKSVNFNCLPTSPITGKKYRSPLCRFSELPKRPVNGNISNDNYANDSIVNEFTESEKSNKNMCEGETLSITDIIGQQKDSNSGHSTPNPGDLDNISNNKNTELSKTRIPMLNESPCSEGKPKLKWMFGPHRNANVLPVQVKKNPGLGFSIAGGVTGAETGIVITKVNPDGPAQGTLRPGDKILEVDGIDFTKSDHDNAVAVLRATGTVVSMMISRHQ